MKKQVLAVSLVLAMVGSSSVFAAVPDHLRVGTDPTYAPFSSKILKDNWWDLIST